MRILIINNKNSESLEKLVESLEQNIKGNWTYEIFDASGKLANDKSLKISSEGKLKDWINQNLSDEPDDLYMIIDENKLLLEEIDIQDISKEMEDQEVFCFSLSLGSNITHCSNMGCDNIFKPISENQKTVKWDWSVHYFDFGYPLNLDGTVFRGRELRKFVKSISFDNSLELENALQIFDNYPKSLMVSFKNGKMIEIIFEKPELWSNFDKKKLKGDRTKYQILEENEVTDKVSNEV